MLSMKMIFSIFICLFVWVYNTFSKYSINQFYNCGKTPIMIEQGYKTNRDAILVENEKYNLSMIFSDNDNCILKVSNKITTLNYCAKIKKEMFDSIHNFYIDDKTPCILISYSVYGATGLSANISLGLLIRLKKTSIDIVELSTFGSLCDSFMDVNNDGSFEFVCTDLYYNDANRYLVRNVFVLTDTVENITDVSKTILINIDDEEIKNIYLKDLNYSLLKEPTIMDGYFR